MSDIMEVVPKESLLRIEWEKYIKTEDYTNTKKWARFKEHIDGSLWAAFTKGFEINEIRIKQLEAENKKLKKRTVFLLKWINDHLKYMNIDYASFKRNFVNALKELEDKP